MFTTPSLYSKMGRTCCLAEIPDSANFLGLLNFIQGNHNVTASVSLYLSWSEEKFSNVEVEQILRDLKTLAASE